ncbi:MAG: helix-turn-helix transcriptional regulator, partial [Oscillospiraceae bacterium]|nr:helix-turn-helix transcriptional regulator [Oscillospiraceae bacterium]
MISFCESGRREPSLKFCQKLAAVLNCPKANLIRYGGFDEQTASDYAYMISEAANWCNFRDMLRLDGRTDPDKIA